MSKDYVVVTTISQFRHKYVMHKDDLQKLYPDYELDAIEWACDKVKEEKKKTEQSKAANQAFKELFGE